MINTQQACITQPCPYFRIFKVAVSDSCPYKDMTDLSVSKNHSCNLDHVGLLISCKEYLTVVPE